MGYGRLGPLEPAGESSRYQSTPNQRGEDGPNPTQPQTSKLKVLLVLSATLILASALAVALMVALRAETSTKVIHARPSQAIAQTCSRTRYPTLCVTSLLDFPGAAGASDNELVHISVNMTLQRFDKALYVVSDLNNLQMDPSVRSAYDDCLELLDGSIDLLSRSLSSISPDGSPSASDHDVRTWLSAALTNQDTCEEGLDEVNGAESVKKQVSERLKDLSELASNCLAIFASINGGDDFAGVPIQNRRRLMNSDHDEVASRKHVELPEWLSPSDRILLDTPATSIQADIIVSKDGNGTVKTIMEAIKKVPDYGNRRIIIYVRAGKYEESNLKVGRKKTNVMFIGDGKGRTVITGGRSVSQDLTTFHTASFAASGAGFIARDMTFENYAGPSKHQAVALRVGADHAAIYRCSIIGYQDTLYVHSQRQFYRECDIYGTVDFIFGNAVVVIQHSNLVARKPNPQQKNTITAQNRKDPNQNTGISIHACRIVAASDLEPVRGSYPTFLGRPWKMYSRTVYLMNYMGDHINPRGWLEWNGNFALDTLYYGEYMNSGPGAAVGQRVKWPGYRVITSNVEANKFTVSQFIYGSSWLPATGVAFAAGLSG